MLFEVNQLIDGNDQRHNDARNRSNRGHIAMTRKLAFMLVMTVAFGAVPQIAYASCSGNACSALTMKLRGYSSAESLLHFDLTNSDKSRAIKVKACIMTAGSCVLTFDPTIYAAKTSELSFPAKPGSNVEVRSADFVVSDKDKADKEKADAKEKADKEKTDKEKAAAKEKTEKDKASAATFVKLSLHNAAKLNMMVDVRDHVANTEDDVRTELTPGGARNSKAKLDQKGFINIGFLILFRDEKNGSFYRCVDVSTQVDGKSELSYDFSVDSGRKC